jgi:hypothetical protein
MTASDHLSRIEAIMAEIERLDRASNGQFREPDDREAFDIAARLERKMAQSFKQECEREGVSRETGERDEKAFV